ncbi:hypothetical protein BH10CYA1_BH10CYA1_55820 [soil metagenome]
MDFINVSSALGVSYVPEASALQEKPFVTQLDKDAEFLQALKSAAVDGSGADQLNAIHLLAKTKDPSALRPLLAIFASGSWDVIWAAQKGLFENFSLDRCTVTAARLLKTESEALPLLAAVAEPVFFSDWSSLQSLEYVEVCKLMAQYSLHENVRDKAMFDGMWTLNDFYCQRTNLSKFSVTMNRRDRELHQLSFLHALAEPNSLSRSSVIQFLLESVSPGTSVFPKNRAKVCLTQIAAKSGLLSLSQELEIGNAIQRYHAVHLLGRLKHRNAMQVLINKLKTADFEMRSHIILTLERFYAEVYKFSLEKIESN